MIIGDRLSLKGVVEAKASLKRRKSISIDPKPGDLSMTRVKQM